MPAWLLPAQLPMPVRWLPLRSLQLQELEQVLSRLWPHMLLPCIEARWQGTCDIIVQELYASLVPHPLQLLR